MNEPMGMSSPGPQPHDQAPPQWQPMTPEQQWHMHQQMLAMQHQQLAAQRQQAELARRNRNTVNTLVGLFVWTPLILLGAVSVLWLVLANL